MVELDKNLSLLTLVHTSSSSLCQNPFQSKGNLHWQMKITEAYPFSPMELTTIENPGNTNHWRGCGENHTLLCCSWECKSPEWLWRKLAISSKIERVGTIQQNDPHSSGPAPKETLSACPVRSGVRMLTAALFVMVKNWKQSEYATRSKWEAKHALSTWQTTLQQWEQMD